MTINTYNEGKSARVNARHQKTGPMRALMNLQAVAQSVPEVPGVYYRVYQDKENMDGGHYVDTLEGVVRSICNWRESAAESDEFLWPVIEPVEMTEEEFKALPEFTGY